MRYTKATSLTIGDWAGLFARLQSLLGAGDDLRALLENCDDEQRESALTICLQNPPFERVAVVIDTEDFYLSFQLWRRI